MDDNPGSWQKGVPVENQSSNHPNNFSTSSNSFSGPVFQSGNQVGSPANNNTPQYTSSPAPSGSSTPGLPGPLAPQNAGNNSGFQPNSNSGSQYNGPGSVVPPQFGSPSASGQQFGRPGSSGPAFGSAPHFPSPGGPSFVAGGQFGMPPGSPFHGVNHGGHVGIMGPQPGDQG
jgi:LIM domain-binding protein 2